MKVGEKSRVQIEAVDKVRTKGCVDCAWLLVRCWVKVNIGSVAIDQELKLFSK